MPNWKTHLLVGFIISIIAFMLMQKYGLTFNYLDIPIAIILVAFFSIFADIDTEESKIKNIIEVAILSYSVVFLITNFYVTQFPQLNNFFRAEISIILIGFLLFLKFFQHRGFFHTIVAGLLFTIPVWFFLGLNLFILSILSFLSHLIIDKNLKLMEA